MLIYIYLFVLGFCNEALLTSYYVNAAKGKRWLCVLLSLAQQVVSWSALFLNIVDVQPASQEQLIRVVVTALSYGCATAWIVKPQKENT